MAVFFGAQAAVAALFGCSLVSALMISTTGARAAELKVLSTVALTPALDELKPKFENAGNRLTIVYNTIAELKKKIEGGETADVIILSRPILDDLRRKAKSRKAASSASARPMSPSACAPVHPARYLDGGEAEGCTARHQIDLLRRSVQGRRQRHLFRQGARSSRHYGSDESQDRAGAERASRRTRRQG